MEDKREAGYLSKLDCDHDQAVAYPRVRISLKITPERIIGLDMEDTSAIESGSPALVKRGESDGIYLHGFMKTNNTEVDVHAVRRR